MIPSDKRRVLAVVPTLGARLDTLDRTLRSLTSDQEGLADVVVVCPRETPALRAIVDAHDVGVLLDPGHISAAVNAGWRRAAPRHQYLLWIGDDDLLYPGALARAVQCLDICQDAVVAFGDCDYIDMAGALLFTRRPPPAAAWWLQFVPGLIKQESCLFRREAVERVGDLDVSLRFAMDLDLLLRLRKAGRFVRIPHQQAAFCWHAGSITIANRERSFAEAQAVQRRQSGFSGRVLGGMLRPVIRWMVLALSASINRRERLGR